MTATSLLGATPDANHSANTTMPPAAQRHFSVAQHDAEAWPIPRMRLVVNDLSSNGAAIFLHHVNATKDLKAAALVVQRLLYPLKKCPRNVRSVTIVLENMGGVAYTKGNELDDDHKEIHVSTSYIEHCHNRAREELLGVLVHEMVHCFQFNGKGTCPGGLIEGIADFVRLKAGLDPPHWQKGGERWDQGYEKTGYFLEWIENTYGDGTIREINERMREKEYDEKIFKELTGKDVEHLWALYKKSLSKC